MSSFSQVLAWLTDLSNWSGTTGIPIRIGQHLAISALAILLASLIALPVGIAIGHTRRGAGLIAGAAGAARAIPTLGLLTLFGLGIGIGMTAPLLALVVLAIPSLLAGTYAGIGSVTPAVVDAARGVGMRERQVIWRVEIPLAAPVIIGGIRAATLQVIATATLAAYISDQGLGRFLFAGLKTRDYSQMIGGAILVIALALLAEAVLALIQSLTKTYVAHTRA
ncbi:MAG: ABC transporter permease subunit [Propionibacteriaceae bacterium]|nr:ABC transporter permease subunit [Propionibacteriaceae bacterium]